MVKYYYFISFVISHFCFSLMYFMTLKTKFIIIIIIIILIVELEKLTLSTQLFDTPV